MTRTGGTTLIGSNPAKPSQSQKRKYDEVKRIIEELAEEHDAGDPVWEGR